MVSRAAFAWVSLMDVLFALFGGLVVLTVLISTKLASVSPIEERPFHSMTAWVTAPESATAQALREMTITFVVVSEGRERCRFNSRDWTGGCDALPRQGHAHRGRLTEFATAAEKTADGVTLAATLLVTEPTDPTSKQDDIRLVPILENVDQLADRSGIANEDLVVGLNVRSLRTVWNVPEFVVRVRDIIDRAMPQAPLSFLPRLDSGAPLLPPDWERNVGPGEAPCVGECGTIAVEKGGVVRVSWH